jgi:hypothetical protein
MGQLASIHDLDTKSISDIALIVAPTKANKHSSGSNFSQIEAEAHLENITLEQSSRHSHNHTMAQFV